MDAVRIGKDRFDEASAVLARAFLDDPAWVWMLPDPKRRAAVLPWLFRIGFDVTTADVYAPPGPLVGAARWLPPGRPQVRIAATLRALVATPFRLGAVTAPFLAYGRSVEQLRTEVAGGDHWYLAGIGVDPPAQRRGVGSALLQPGIEGAAAQRVPAVLLTNNEANVPFYEHRGFVVVRRGRTPENGPEAWAMVRSP